MFTLLGIIRFIKVLTIYELNSKASICFQQPNLYILEESSLTILDYLTSTIFIKRIVTAPIERQTDPSMNLPKASANNTK